MNKRINPKNNADEHPLSSEALAQAGSVFHSVGSFHYAIASWDKRGAARSPFLGENNF